MFEKDDHQLKSIPVGIWWALITMTTVGYGDVVPISLGIFLSDDEILTFLLGGKIVGAICAMMGILCMSFPVPVFVSHFNYLYNLEKRDCKLTPEQLTQENV